MRDDLSIFVLAFIQVIYIVAAYLVLGVNAMYIFIWYTVVSYVWLITKKRVRGLENDT